jgi:hypothetical protein
MKARESKAGEEESTKTRPFPTATTPAMQRLLPNDNHIGTAAWDEQILPVIPSGDQWPLISTPKPRKQYYK